jgi:hypothetical protein
MSRTLQSLSVFNPDYLQRGHYPINKDTFIVIILIFEVILLQRRDLFGNDSRRITITFLIN